MDELGFKLLNSAQGISLKIRSNGLLRGLISPRLYLLNTLLLVSKKEWEGGFNQQLRRLVSHPGTTSTYQENRGGGVL